MYRFPPDLSTQPHRNPPVRFANAEFPSKRRRPVPGVSLKPPVRQFPPQTACPKEHPSPPPRRILLYPKPSFPPKNAPVLVNEPPGGPAARVFRRRPPRRNQPPGSANGIRPQKFSRSGVYSEAPKGQPPRKPQLHFRTASIPRTCPSLYPDRTLSSPTHAPRHLSKFVNERPKQIRPKNFPPSAEFSDRAWKLPLDASPDPRPVNLLRGPPAPKCPSLSTSPQVDPPPEFASTASQQTPNPPGTIYGRSPKPPGCAPPYTLPAPLFPPPRAPKALLNRSIKPPNETPVAIFPAANFCPSERCSPPKGARREIPRRNHPPTARINFHFFPIQIPDTRSLQIHQRGRAPPNQKSLPKNTAPKIFGGSI